MRYKIRVELPREQLLDRDPTWRFVGTNYQNIHDPQLSYDLLCTPQEILLYTHMPALCYSRLRPGSNLTQSHFGNDPTAILGRSVPLPWAAGIPSWSQARNAILNAWPLGQHTDIILSYKWGGVHQLVSSEVEWQLLLQAGLPPVMVLASAQATPAPSPAPAPAATAKAVPTPLEVVQGRTRPILSVSPAACPPACSVGHRQHSRSQQSKNDASLETKRLPAQEAQHVAPQSIPEAEADRPIGLRDQIDRGSNQVEINRDAKQSIIAVLQKQGVSKSEAKAEVSMASVLQACNLSPNSEDVVRSGKDTSFRSANTKEKESNRLSTAADDRVADKGTARTPEIGTAGKENAKSTTPSNLSNEAEAASEQQLGKAKEEEVYESTGQSVAREQLNMVPEKDRTSDRDSRLNPFATPFISGPTSSNESVASPPTLKRATSASDSPKGSLGSEHEAPGRTARHRTSGQSKALPTAADVFRACVRGQPLPFGVAAEHGNTSAIPNDATSLQTAAPEPKVGITCSSNAAKSPAFQPSLIEAAPQDVTNAAKPSLFAPRLAAKPGMFSFASGPPAQSEQGHSVNLGNKPVSTSVFNALHLAPKTSDLSGNATAAFSAEPAHAPGDKPASDATTPLPSTPLDKSAEEPATNAPTAVTSKLFGDSEGLAGPPTSDVLQPASEPIKRTSEPTTDAFTSVWRFRSRFLGASSGSSSTSLFDEPKAAIVSDRSGKSEQGSVGSCSAGTATVLTGGSTTGKGETENTAEP